ncbi:hypothetical protein C8T65DRAFT_641239 [Cerioporus squamosus]|nr:hypothetical protein C8T65DRAFT_641239 [Cerioporus squamosus]
MPSLLCLERSGALPLEIRFHDVDVADSEDARDLVVPHVLPGPDRCNLCNLNYLVKVPMPLLEEFIIVGVSALDINRFDHPALHVLRADRFEIDWKKLPYEHLRVLDLDAFSRPRHEDRIPFFDAYLRNLGSFQELEELNLIHSIPLETFYDDLEDEMREYWRSSRIISLPRLRKLTLFSNSSSFGHTQVFAILSHLRLAKSTSVRIWMGLDDVGISNVRGLSSLLPHDSQLAPESLTFTAEASGGATLAVRYEMCNEGWMEDVYLPNDALSDFCTLFSRAPLTQLKIDSNTSFESSFRTFRTFPSLRGLTIDLGGHLDYFTILLFALSADSGSRDKSDVTLPALQTLHLCHWQAPWGARYRALRNAPKLTIQAAPLAGEDNPDDFDYEDMHASLGPFVGEHADLILSYNV